MQVVELIGRLMFAAMFVNSGIGHFRTREGMTAYAKSAGAPGPELMVPLTGAMILGGGLLIALGVWADLGALLIFAFLVPTTFYMHGFWAFDEPQQRMAQHVHFMKNMSLAGGALVIFYLYQQFGDAPWALTGPLFG